MSVPTALLNAAKVMGVPLASKLLRKSNKGFSKFFDNALVQGFSLDQAMDYLVNRFSGHGGQSFREGLESREAKGQARPDERAALQDVQSSRGPARAIQTAASYAAPFAFQGKQEDSTFPQTAEPEQPQAPMNPEAGPLKGVGKGIEGAKQRSDTYRKMGAYPEDLGAEKQQQTVREAATYDPLSALKKHPELIKFIQKELSSGGNIESIGSKARKSPRLSDVVRTIEEDIGEQFESFLGRLIDQQRQGSQSGQQQGPSPAMSEFMAAMQQFKSMMAGRQNG